MSETDMATQLSQKFKTTLRAKGYKATPSRLAVLTVLEKAEKPLSPQHVAEKVGNTMNLATVYRILTALKDVGLVRQVDFQHGHSHYELADNSDHHHFVCTRCGKVADFEGCTVDRMIRTALKKTPSFANVTEHSLEVFGVCMRCAAQ